jgi:two-component system cell cycle sensor histidine kinase/response regulator CckA
MVRPAGEGSPEGGGREGDGALTPSTETTAPLEKATNEGTSAVAIVGANGRLRAASASFSSALKTRRDELFERPITAAVRVEDRPALAHAIEAVATGDWPSCALEVTVVPRSRAPVQVRLELEAETQRRVRLVATDLSTARNAARTLEEQEENLRSLTSLSLDMWGLVDGAGQVRLLSDSITAHLGWTAADVKGHSFLEIVHPDDIQWITGILSSLKGDPFAVHHTVARARHKDGGWRTLEASISGYNPRLLGQGHYIISAHDITARQRTEATLREVESRYSELIAQAPTGIIVVQRGRVVHANARFLELTGLSAVALARRPRVNSLVAGSSAAALRRVRDEVASGKRQASRVTIDGSHADGHTLALEVATSVVEFGGRPALLCTVTDLTESRQMQARVAEAEKDQAIALLAGGVAHDFNNLLTAIVSWTDIASDDLGPDHPAASALGEIQAAADRATELVRQLLAYGRRQLLEPAPLDLGETVVRLQRWIDRVLGSQHRLSVTVPDAPWKVRADRVQLDWALTALVMHAKDALPDGGTIGLTVEHEVIIPERAELLAPLKAGEHVAVAVRYDGPPMDEATRRRIFEPFYSTLPRAQQVGAGIGLAAVLGIVVQSGGMIDVRSGAGSGTEFRCYFPRLA